MLGKAPALQTRFADAYLYAPDHLPLEAASALTKYVRAGLRSPHQAADALADILDLRIELVPTAPLVPAAFQAGLEYGLKVYDAAYLVVAEAMKVALVTADTRLAAAYERSELIS